MQEVYDGIYKIENFLPPRFHFEMKNLLFSKNYPWYYLKNATHDEESGYNKYHFGFSNAIFVDDVRSFEFNFFWPMIYYIPVGPEVDLEIIRIRAGMQTKINDDGCVNDPHRDLKEPHKTLLYYVNESDGNTMFYLDGTGKELIFENAPIENSAVIFDGDYYHASSHPTIVPSRVTININYRELI